MRRPFFFSLTASADGRYAGEGAVLDKRTAVHGDSLSVALSGSSSLSATCNMMPLARPGAECSSAS